MAKAKAKTIIVLLRSVVSGHYWPMRRPRLADKIEIIRYDPYVQRPVLYKEVKKIKSVV